MATITILGTGNVGRALAARLQAAGHALRFGVRQVEKARQELGPGFESSFVGAANEAVQGSAFVLVAVPAAAALGALTACDGATGALSGLIIIDATNPLRWENGPVWNPPAEGSMTAAIAAAFPHARVVKAFNHFGAEIQADPAMAHGAADAFVAGDDAATRQQVMAIVNSMGFEAVDAGPLRNAAVLENLAVLWIHLATVGGRGRQFAVRLEGRG